MKLKELKMIIRDLNDLELTDEIDLDQDQEQLEEDFMSTMEKLDDEKKIKKVDKEIVDTYTKLVKAGMEKDGDNDKEEDLDDMSAKELRKLASKLDIEDPEDMGRKELVKAIKKAQKAAEKKKTKKSEKSESEDLDDMSAKELRKMASKLDIDDADDMSRKELVKAIEKANKKSSKKKGSDTAVTEDELDDMSTKEIRKLANKLDIEDADELSRKQMIKKILAATKTKKRSGKSFNKPEGALSLSTAVAKGFKKYKGKETTIKKISNAANDYRTESGGADNYKSANAYVKFIMETLVMLGVAKQDGNDVELD